MAKDIEKLRSAIKEKDGWWASLFSGPLANRFLEPICDLDWVTPNRITIASFLIGVAAAICFALGSHQYLIIGAILVQLSFIVDCMDGQLARYRQQFSDLGAWLDRVSDRIKDFLYFFCLAYGYFINHRAENFASDVKSLLGANGDLTFQTWMVWPLAMTASFTVFLIDYYVNQDMKLGSFKKDTASEIESSSTLPTQENSSFLKRSIFSLLRFGLSIYRAVPILRFNIGEQALIISIFCLFNAAVPLLFTFALLGSFYSIYWPIAKLYGFTESK